MTPTDDLLARLEYWGGKNGFTPIQGTALGGYVLDAAARIRALEAELSEARMTLMAQMGQAADRYDALHGVAIGLAGAAKDALTFLRFDCPDFMTSHHPEMRVLETALAAWEKHNWQG